MRSFKILSDSLLIESYLRSLSPKFDPEFRKQLLDEIISRNIQSLINESKVV